MERFSDTGIVLRHQLFKDRDVIAVCLTQTHGKVTAIAKNAVNARRFGGSLDFLACSKMDFVQKPHSDMSRIDGAVVHFEFNALQADFERFTAASFLAEFCLKLLEDHNPANEMYVILSNSLFYMNSGRDLKEVLNVFLCKSFRIMGYAPNLLRCVSCNRPAHEVLEAYLGPQGPQAAPAPYFWTSRGGGMACFSCAGGQYPESLRKPLKEETLLLFHQLTTKSFKELFNEGEKGALFATQHPELYPILVDFLHHHVPGLPVTGFKSWALLSSSL